MKHIHIYCTERICFVLKGLTHYFFNKYLLNAYYVHGTLVFITRQNKNLFLHRT